MALERRPINGMRLAYQVQMGGEQFRILMKEPIGDLLGLKPVDTSSEGTFLTGPQAGKKFLTKAPGFRFQSYKFLVKPGTTIAEPTTSGTCKTARTRNREICSFSIGFSRGKTNVNGAQRTAVNITRWRVKSWIRRTKAANKIIGMITPSGNRHIWSKTGGNGILPDIGFPGFPGFPDLPELPSLPPGLPELAGEILPLIL
ncbi:MAG: hypothetical protein F6K62_16795 [Sphaerospermopsis sp. SIO1G2]|nr:hypothetical protein [Sphaerospermopsis sp. SIO1G2]